MRKHDKKMLERRFFRLLLVFLTTKVTSTEGDGSRTSHFMLFYRLGIVNDCTALCLRLADSADASLGGLPF